MHLAHAEFTVNLRVFSKEHLKTPVKMARVRTCFKRLLYTYKSLLLVLPIFVRCHYWQAAVWLQVLTVLKEQVSPVIVNGYRKGEGIDPDRYPTKSVCAGLEELTDKLATSGGTIFFQYNVMFLDLNSENCLIQSLPVV